MGIRRLLRGFPPITGRACRVSLEFPLTTTGRYVSMNDTRPDVGAFSCPGPTPGTSKESGPPAGERVIAVRRMRVMTILQYASMALSVGALVWGWVNQRERQAAEQRLDSLRRSHYRLVDDTRREIEGLQKQVRDLKLEIRRQAGTLRFEPTMRVDEAYQLHPEAQAVFAAFHLGGCSSCAVSPDDTIESAARSHGVDPDALLSTLNSLLDSEQSESVLRQLERRPNVSLQL